MLHKTKGIVLHNLPYNDKYIIVTMYTEDFGRISYMVSNTHGKKTKISRSLLQPLSVLDMEVEHLNNRDIQRIKEAKSGLLISQLHYHPAKTAISLFLSEVLYRIIQEREANRPLFDYLHRSISWLEIANDGIANYHLAFLLQLSTYLGIRPNGESYKTGCFFDLLNGVFSGTLPEHNKYLNKNESIVFERLLRINYENMALYTFSRQERANIIRQIIEYYRLHLSDFPEIKSLAVMQSLFDS
ncbi:MAG: DNA repair protein RecO [Tannerella sp.]|jgi:DNA repair protein RecO (recombination protein O)|nr:DNA repair protein RecO [Tannerella sp.]